MYGYNPYLQNYPQNYQNNFNSNQNTQGQQSNVPQDERIWVQNETSAEAYLLAPNGFARLWDSSNNRFYEKRADATGRPLPMDIYEYKRITPQNTISSDNGQNISMDEINARFEQINERIDTLERAKKVVKNAKQSNVDDSEV